MNRMWVQWEYRRVMAQWKESSVGLASGGRWTIRWHDRREEEMVDGMNRLGSEGWELASTVPMSLSGSPLLLLFKRPVGPSEESAPSATAT